MRTLSKVLTGSMIAAAALAVSACGSKTETTVDNTTVTDLNTTDDMGTMTDNMTAVDGAMNGTDAGNVVADNATTTTTTTNTTTTNGM
jgi:hypothetical protein